MDEPESRSGFSSLENEVLGAGGRKSRRSIGIYFAVGCVGAINSWASRLEFPWRDVRSSAKVVTMLSRGRTREDIISQNMLNLVRPGCRTVQEKREGS